MPSIEPTITCLIVFFAPNETLGPIARCLRAQSDHRRLLSRASNTASPSPISCFGASANSLSDASLHAFALMSREPGRLIATVVQTRSEAGAVTLVGGPSILSRSNLGSCLARLLYRRVSALYKLVRPGRSSLVFADPRVPHLTFFSCWAQQTSFVPSPETGSRLSTWRMPFFRRHCASPRRFFSCRFPKPLFSGCFHSDCPTSVQNVCSCCPFSCNHRAWRYCRTMTIFCAPSLSHAALWGLGEHGEELCEPFSEHNLHRCSFGCSHNEGLSFAHAGGRHPLQTFHLLKGAGGCLTSSFFAYWAN